MPMLHHFFSNYGIVFYYPNDLVTTQHPMGISNRLTVVLQQELH